MNKVIELTYSITGEKTLINTTLITSTYRMLEKRTNRNVTKINFVGGTYTFVDEKQNEIQEMASHLIRLTYTENGKSVLFNPNNMVYCHDINDQVTGNLATKIIFTDGSYQIVQDDKDTIQVFIDDLNVGFFQPTDWVDFEFTPTPSGKKRTKSFGLSKSVF